MPRRDRTFTAADCIRFWGKNLDRREQLVTLLFFHFFTKNVVEEIIRERLSVIENLLLTIATGSILGFLRRALFRRVKEPVVRRILRSLLPTEQREILKAVDRNPSAS